MKTYQTEQIKNFTLLGNAGSGKTTMAESILFDGGIIDRRGKVESKNTVSDYHEIELDHLNSIFSTVLYTEHNDHKLNFIDAPGADDFTGGVISSLKVTDTGVMLINAQQGVEVGTEIQSRYLEQYNKPMILVVNQLDSDKANYEKTMESLKLSFGPKAAVVQYPVNPGTGFNTIIDVLTMSMLKYPSDGGNPEVTPVPDDQKDQAEALRNELIEYAAENDEALMEKYFEEGTLSDEDINSGLSIGLAQRGIFPVFCTSAKNNMGITSLLDFISNVAPSPAQMPAPKNTEGNEIVCDPSAPAILFVFKTSIESHIGEITFFKVMSGEIKEGIDLINNNNSTKERLSQLYAVAGKNRNKVPQMYAGDIGATVKLKNTHANHTLGKNSQTGIVEPIIFPEPKYRTAIKPVSEGDEEKLGEIFHRITEEDPTIIVEYSKELKQIIVHGQGEHHLNIVKWQLDNIFKLETEFLAPRIPYRETITKTAKAVYRHKKQSGGAGQFGEVHMVIEPYKDNLPDPSSYKVGGSDIKISVRGKEELDLNWGGKLIYYNCIVGGSIDSRFMPAILKGIMEKMEEGPLTGCHARDIRVAVYDGKMHPVDSNDISFRLAGRNAFRDAFKNAGPKILEPIYDIEVFVPSDRMGDVISDLQSRRAIVQGMNSEGRYEKINAQVPLSEMNKYSTALSSLTGGRATYTMKFSKYEQVPPDEQMKLLKAYEEDQDEE